MILLITGLPMVLTVLLALVLIPPLFTLPITCFLMWGVWKKVLPLKVDYPSAPLVFFTLGFVLIPPVILGGFMAHPFLYEALKVFFGDNEFILATLLWGFLWLTPYFGTLAAFRLTKMIFDLNLFGSSS